MRETKRVRDFNSFDEDKFLHELETLNWNSLYFANDMDAKVEIFNKFLLDSYNKHAPFKVIRPKHAPVS